ncbi:MAG TPA: hypothetical protein VG737_09565, partial [Cyclobacteriaceae bacterium]|nr:hypothetical protein [Cyclobacteriaceae bacterium]
IFVKPATTPYRMEVKLVENEIENSVAVKWQARRSTLMPHQEKFMKKIAAFLKKNPRTHIVVHPVVYASKEREYILFFETKKKYFLIAHKKEKKDFTAEDSAAVEQMSIKDAGLVKRVSRGVSDTVMFTMQERFMHFVGKKIVDKKLAQLNADRVKSFRSFFEQETEPRIKFRKPINDIPYNGFSFFKIEYENGMPDELRKAYHEMLELNDEAPRNKYLRARKKDPTIPREVVSK